MRIYSTLFIAALTFLAVPAYAQGTDRFGQVTAASTLQLGQATITGDTTNATAQLGEIGISPFATGKSHWFRINTDRPYRFTANTAGSQFDTTLAVYRGANLSELALLAGNDDRSQSDLSSAVEVTLGHGTFYVAIDGARNNSGSGNYTFNYSFTPTGIPLAIAPPNDNFANAAALAVGDVVFLNSPVATLENGEPAGAARTAWYRFTAPATQRYTVRTVNAAFDSIIHVYTGTAVNALTLVESLDDLDFINGNLDSEVTINASVGTTYWIRVGTVSDTRGTTMVTLVPARAQGYLGLDATFGGTWWNPNRAGEGILIEVARHPDPDLIDRSLLFFAWFTYDPNGNPVYLSGPVTATASAVGQQLEIPVTITRGARFGTAFRAQDVAFTNWGTVRLRYLNCNELTLNYAPSLPGWGNAGSIDLTRTFNRGVGASCP